MAIDKSESSNSVIIARHSQQTMAFYKALNKRSDEQIEELFIERLAANFNYVFEKKIQDSLNKIDQKHLSDSVAHIREEIVALYQYLYHPIVEEHLSEEIIAMPTRDRLLHACERLFDLFSDFNADNSKVESLKYSYSEVLSEVLEDVSLKTITEINHRNKTDKNLDHPIAENKHVLKPQLENLIKAQHIGELLTQLEVIKNSSKDDTFVKSLITQLLQLPFINSHDYVAKYIKFIDETIYNLNQTDKVTLKEKSQLLSCLMRFYCGKYQSDYSSIQDVLKNASNEDVSFFKLQFLKYDFILKLPKIKKGLPSAGYNLVNSFVFVLNAPKDYIQFATLIINYFTDKKGLNKSELALLAFSNNILNEIALRGKAVNGMIEPFNDACLAALESKFNMKFPDSSTTEDAKKDTKGKGRANGKGLGLWKYKGISLGKELIDPMTLGTSKMKLLEKLLFIDRFLNGDENPCFKFRPSDDSERSQLENIHQVASEHSHIIQLEEYQSKRKNSIMYLLYDSYNDDKTGRNPDKKTKKSRLAQANKVINKLKDGSFNYNEVVPVIVTSINEIKEANSSFKHSLYKVSSDMFHQLNDHRKRSITDSQPEKDLEIIHALNRDVFNNQILSAIGYVKNYEDYASASTSFSVFQDIFNSEGLWARLTNSLEKCWSAFFNKQIRQRFFEVGFHKEKKLEYTEIANINTFIARYDDFLKDHPVSEFYAELFILCDNAIRATANEQLHESLRRVKEQIVLRFRPSRSQDSHVSFETSQIQRMKFSNQITWEWVSKQMTFSSWQLNRQANFEYLQNKKTFSKQTKIIAEKLEKSSKDERAQLVYDALLLKICNRYLAEKSLASGVVQRAQSKESKLISTFENSLQKVGCPKAVLAVTEPLKGYLSEQQKSQTVKIAKSAPLTADVDRTSAHFAEKIRDMYRYQIQELIEPHYLKLFVDILVERYFAAVASGCEENMILTHIYNNCQKHSWFGFGMTNAGEKEMVDNNGKKIFKSLKMENILSRPGVVVFDEKGEAHYYTMSENYDSASCQYNVYGFVVLERDQLPKDMVEITSASAISPEIKRYYEKNNNTKSVLINNEQNKQELESSQLVDSVINTWRKDMSNSSLSQSVMWKSRHESSVINMDSEPRRSPDLKTAGITIS